jgi:putative flippase GtrA
MNRVLSPHFLRFCISGLAVTAVHTLIAGLLMLSLSQSAGIANGAAFLGASLISYLLNTYWSFCRRHTAKQLLRFMLISLAGFFISSGLANWVAMQNGAWWQSIMLVTVCMPPLMYFAHRAWTYA